MRAERDWGLWALLLLAACACHASWQLTDTIGFDLTPLAFVTVLYSGYKFDRWSGAALGLLSSLILLLWAWYDERVSSMAGALLGPTQFAPFDDAEGLTLRDFAAQDALLFALVGYFGGWAADAWTAVFGRPLSNL